MAKVMLATGLIVAYGYSVEAFMAWYSGNHYERFMMLNRVFGPYSWAYWALIFCNVLVRFGAALPVICARAAMEPGFLSRMSAINLRFSGVRSRRTVSTELKLCTAASFGGRLFPRATARISASNCLIDLILNFDMIQSFRRVTLTTLVPSFCA